MTAQTHEKKLKVLMIGNSFTQSVPYFFPSIVEASGSDSLVLEMAAIGGYTLATHCDDYYKSEQNPEHRPYWTGFKQASLHELLSEHKWDIVTVQQASDQSCNHPVASWRADELISLIRHHQPEAEIMTQLIWAFRADDAAIRIPGGYWEFDQHEMHERLLKSYGELAETHHLRVIPVGLAVEIAREKSPLKFKNYGPAILDALNPPDVPPQAGDPVGDIRWRKDEKTGELFLYRDTSHMNVRGKYLQACVWYILLYGRTAEEIKYIPKELSDSEAKLLARCAEQAVREYKQVK